MYLLMLKKKTKPSVDLKQKYGEKGTEARARWALVVLFHLNLEQRGSSNETVVSSWELN